jgi:hypothetical protein
MRRKLRQMIAEARKQMADLPNIAIKPDDKPSFQMVRVLNKNDFPITDMYDGVPYTFEPGKTLSIPPEAAQHFFAWPADSTLSRMWIAKRLGWNTGEDIKRQADGRMRWEHWVDKIEISAVSYDLVARNPDEPIPADPGEGDERMSEDEDLTMPAATTDITGTRVGRRKRDVPAKRPPRRVNV